MSEGVVRAAEDAVVRDPDAVGHWTAYLSARRDAGWAVRRAVFERAVRHAPGSYKLWSMYLREQRVRLRGRRGQSSEVGRAVGVFERALVYMHKMPRIWIMYGELLEECGMASAFRRAMDRALCALPVTQHDRIWTLYLAFVEKFPKEIWQVGVQVFPRYLEFQPRERERYVEYLLAARQFEIAIEQLSAIVQDKNFVSVKGRTAHSLWMQLCTLVVQHADKVQKMGKARLDAERLIRAGLGRFTDETGRLWCSLAEYYVRIGQFDKAQEIYEEGVHAVNTVRDFSTIFDAYTQFHEGMLNAKIDLFGDDEEQKDDQETQHAFYDINMDAEDKINDVDLRLALMEQLIEERPFLLSAVLLRQNPHNCEEWHKRAGLYRAKDDMASVVETYKDAVAKLDPARAVGSPYTLWTKLARVYEDHGNVEEAREVFRTATGHNFVDVDDLVHIYCAFAEMEIRQGDFGAALNLVRGSVSKSKPLRVSDKPFVADQASKLHRRLQRSTLLWSLYADLEESLGSLRSARAAYDRMLELKVTTPQTILNYAAMLEENKFFEDAFQAYERGVALFSWPHVGDIWITYLFKFAERYKGEKMFRLREMYEQAVGGAPSDKCRPLYLMLSKVEEEFGNPRRALSALDRLCSAAPVEERGDLFLLYIGKAEELFGISRAREVFELAINQLEDPSQVRELCLHYAEKERRLGEIDRARSILRHGAQFADPRTVITYWRTWNDFEVAHGNEDTFREMLRVKRTIQVQYNDTNYSLASNVRGKGPHAHGSNSSKAKGHFESATPATSTEAVNAPGGGSQLAEEENKRHLDPSERGDDHTKRPKLGDSNDDDEVSVQAVPRSVFGGATA